MRIEEIPVIQLRVGDLIIPRETAHHTRPCVVQIIEHGACAQYKTHINERDCYDSESLVTVIA